MEIQIIFVCWFCIMQLYWICWLLVTIFGALVRIFFCKIKSSTDRDNFTNFFPILMYFISFSWLTALRFPVLYWIEVVGSGHLCFLLILDRELSNFHLWVWSSYGLVIYAPYYVEVCSFYTHFVECFYPDRMLNYVKCFICVYWDDHIIFIFYSINMVYHIYWFAFVEPSLHPRVKFHLIKCVIILVWSLNLVC